jgi:hypothetical protein
MEKINELRQYAREAMASELVADNDEDRRLYADLAYMFAVAAYQAEAETRLRNPATA